MTGTCWRQDGEKGPTIKEFVARSDQKYDFSGNLVHPRFATVYIMDISDWFCCYRKTHPRRPEIVRTMGQYYKVENLPSKRKVVSGYCSVSALVIVSWCCGNDRAPAQAFQSGGQHQSSAPRLQLLSPRKSIPGASDLRGKHTTSQGQMETPGPHGQHLCLVPCGNYNLEEDHGDHLLPSEFIPLFSGFSPFGFIHFCFFFNIKYSIYFQGFRSDIEKSHTRKTKME